jgi:hypothetical protein
MSSPSSTETRGAWLWRKMMFIYGARFLDMWEGVDVNEMQTTWTDALRGMSRDDLQRGVAALYRTRHPPTLPDFLELCKPVPAMYRANPLALDAPRTPPEQAREQLAKLRDIANDLLRKNGVPLGGGIRWAYRLLQRASDGENITQHQIAFAKEAIENYNRTHGRSSPREPGDDDEPEVTQ